MNYPIDDLQHYIINTLYDRLKNNKLFSTTLSNFRNYKVKKRFKICFNKLVYWRPEADSNCRLDPLNFCSGATLEDTTTS